MREKLTGLKELMYAMSAKLHTFIQFNVRIMKQFR